MTAAVILLSLTTAVLLALLIFLRLEIRHITKQTAELKAIESNRIVHSESGSLNALIREINALLTEMQENRIRFSRKNHALEQMMTNISHDLRTPLTSAMGYLNLVRNARLPETEKQRELEIIEKRLLRLDELINSFFELSKIISSGKQPERTEINLISVLEESVAHYYDDFSGQNRTIHLQSGQRRLLLRSNRNMLIRIFDNLIANALKHGSGDLTIQVEEAETVRIVLINRLEGAAIDTEHIFDEYYTTDISRTKGNTGLGLAIAKQFTEMLNGEISAVHENQQFTLTIIFQK